jgi:hypothetical protein
MRARLTPLHSAPQTAPSLAALGASLEHRP